MAFSVLLLLINAALVHSTDSNLDLNQLDSINYLGIVGGQKADRHKFPYQITVESPKSLFCGGSIIASEWIITAAHCIYGYKPNEIKINYNKSNDQSFDADKLYLHENYRQIHHFNNDIALIKLAKPLKLNNETKFKPIELADKNFDPIENSTVTISGWGALNENCPNLPNELYSVNVTVIDRIKCNELFVKYKTNVTENMFCAGDLEHGDKDSCFGDSGGPVVQDGKLIGIVSWGIGCARKYLPGVYTRVGNYIDWIQSKIQE